MRGKDVRRERDQKHGFPPKRPPFGGTIDAGGKRVPERRKVGGRSDRDFDGRGGSNQSI